MNVHAHIHSCNYNPDQGFGEDFQHSSMIPSFPCPADTLLTQWNSKVTTILDSITIDGFCRFLNLIYIESYSIYYLVSFTQRKFCEIRPCFSPIVSLFFIIVIYHLYEYSKIYLYISFGGGVLCWDQSE